MVVVFDKLTQACTASSESQQNSKPVTPQQTVQSSKQMAVENNNNAINQKDQPNQQRRMSRTVENGNPKTPTTENQNNKSPSETHYIKNKSLQSPVNRYRELEEKTTKSKPLSNSSSVTHSNSELNTICPHTRGSNKNLNQEPQRRVSVQIGTPIKGNFVVSQSDLWDTHTLSHAKQRQSPRNHANPQRCQEHSHFSSPYDQNSSPSGPIQRSVSEKNRTKHRHKPKQPLGQSETDSERERDSVRSTTPQRKLMKSLQHSHHHSSPNVAPDKQRKHRTKPELFGASSESELLDGDTAILPIFRKLLTEKQPRYRGRGSIFGASCPNISIKCDIVEYL